MLGQDDLGGYDMNEINDAIEESNRAKENEGFESDLDAEREANLTFTDPGTAFSDEMADIL